MPLSGPGSRPARCVTLLALGWVALAGVAALVCFVQAAAEVVPRNGGPYLVVEHVPRWLMVGLLPPSLFLALWRWRRFVSKGAA